MRRLHVLLLAGAASALIGGCFFEPRDPDSGGTAQVCFESFPSREFGLVFQNLDGAYACLQQDTIEDQLAADFTFKPAPSVEAQFPNVFDNWDAATESAWLSSLFAGTDSLLARLRITDVQPPSGDATFGPLVVEASYRVRHVPRGGTAIVYRGEAFYTLKVVATNWVLETWEEKESPVGQIPLGNLRGGFAP